MSEAPTILYDLAFTIAFSLHARSADGSDVSPAALRIAILARLASLPDDELLEAVGAPFDSYEVDAADPARATAEKAVRP